MIYLHHPRSLEGTVGIPVQKRGTKTHNLINLLSFGHLVASLYKASATHYNTYLHS